MDYHIFGWADIAAFRPRPSTDDSVASPRTFDRSFALRVRIFTAVPRIAEWRYHRQCHARSGEVSAVGSRIEGCPADRHLPRLSQRE
jgi:hypothetical protein